MVVNDQVGNSHERSTLGEGLQVRKTGGRQYLEFRVVAQGSLEGFLDWVGNISNVQVLKV